MATQTYTGHFEGDGLAVNIETGFVPQYVTLYQDVNKTSPDKIEWFEGFEDETALFGLQTTGSTGVVTRLTTAATGISAYSEATVGVLIDSPQDSGKQVLVTSITDWAVSTAYTPARTAFAVGQIIRPTVHNGYVYELTVAGTSGTTEPTFPTNPGDSVVDNTATWTCRDSNVTKGDFNGFTVGATAQTDEKEYYFIAVGSDKDQDKGDAAEL